MTSAPSPISHRPLRYTRNRRQGSYGARRAAAGADPREQLFAFIDAYLARGADADPRAVAAWVVIGAEAVRQPEVRAVYAEAIETALGELHGLIRGCLRAEGKGTRGARRLAAAVLSTIEGAYLLSAAAPGVLPAGYAAPAVRRLIEGLLAAEPGA